MAGDQTDPAAPAAAVRADLQRLIEALDRRVPHLERVGEAKIARDAAELRARAVEMIKEIDEAVSRS